MDQLRDKKISDLLSDLIIFGDVQDLLVNLKNDYSFKMIDTEIRVIKFRITQLIGDLEYEKLEEQK
jgi:hypothetical protein